MKKTSEESAAQFHLVNTVYGDRKGGLLQLGCLYAWKMQNEQSKEILLVTNAWMMFALFSLVTWPLEPISKGTIKHL